MVQVLCAMFAAAEDSGKSSAPPGLVVEIFEVANFDRLCNVPVVHVCFKMFHLYEVRDLYNPFQKFLKVCISILSSVGSADRMHTQPFLFGLTKTGFVCSGQSFR